MKLSKKQIKEIMNNENRCLACKGITDNKVLENNAGLCKVCNEVFETVVYN